MLFINMVCLIMGLVDNERKMLFCAIVRLIVEFPTEAHGVGYPRGSKTVAGLKRP
jgi:hypothetical protein